MIKQFVPASGDFLLGTLLTDWTRAKQIMKRVKKWAHLNYYVQIDELTFDEVCILQTHLPKKKIGDCGKNGYDCVVRVYGPRILTTKPDTFFVVQIGKSGEPHVSVPLTKEQAYKSANAARGVKSHVCQVIDVVDSTAKGDASSIYSARLV